MEPSGNIPSIEPQDGLSSIENLPIDITFEIMKRLPDINSLLSLIQASPSAIRTYNASQFNQNTIIKGILSTELEGNLPMAVKRLQAFRIKNKPMRPYGTFPRWDYDQMMSEFTDVYISGMKSSQVVVPLDYFTLETALEISSFHTCVLRWVDILAKRMPRGPSNGRAFGFLSPLSIRYLDDEERYRIMKMLYITEITSILLPVVYAIYNYNSLEDEIWQSFWYGFHPWEYCQFLDMQQVLYELCDRKLRDHYYYKHSPIGIKLRQIRMLNLSKEETLELICRVTAFQAGLEALLDVVPSARSDPKKSVYQPDILDVIQGLDAPLLITSRFVQHANDRLRTDYNRWLAYGYKNPEDHSFDGRELYFPRFADKPHESAGVDEGPLRCWLFDITKYSERHNLDNSRVWPRDNPNFVMTSFLSAYRWDSEEWPLPSLSDLRDESGKYVLTRDSELIPIPSRFYKSSSAYQIGGRR
ncbi:uncharacterized protein GGS22DRAFT_196957 [Annulohypoxylon maeteangense]|uniref:uncharacterized protein n=1 Tax=Annulohypoxylon maeteangense TaxID=1927788 RepID=UPI0020086926|nr:uncharacterized protein GGS22DRAFT_196957 [Annulohypoxylon maeteangense]KAI0889442.1 hypothetical protein GGS22DRAFT_196957 [Annulohypoxylon maeteangense]